MKILDWFIANWEALAATLGVGGAGWIGGKKALDKRQDAAIEDIHKRLDEMDVLIRTVQNEQALNLQADISRSERINEKLNKVETMQEKMYDLLMEIVTGKIKLK
jgi:hypothetical protein